MARRRKHVARQAQAAAPVQHAAPQDRGQRRRLWLLLSVAVVLGIGCGVALAFLRDRFGGAEDAILDSDGPGLVALAQDASHPKHVLAELLLAYEHGGDWPTPSTLKDLVLGTSPEQLYARALARRVGNEDSQLTSDLATANNDHPLVALARFQSAEMPTRDEVEAVARVAFSPQRPLHALTQLARRLAVDDPALAQLALDTAKQRAPHDPVVVLLDAASRALSGKDAAAADLSLARPSLAGEKAVLALFDLATRKQWPEAMTQLESLAPSAPEPVARAARLFAAWGQRASTERLLAALPAQHPATVLAQAVAAISLPAVDEQALSPWQEGRRTWPGGSLRLDRQRGDVVAFSVDGQPDQAFDRVRLTTTTNLKDALTRMSLTHVVEAALATGDVARALSALSALPGERDADVRVLEARIRIAQGDADSAKAALEQALSGANDEPTLLGRIVDVAIIGGQYGVMQKVATRLRALGITDAGAQAGAAIGEARDGALDGDVGKPALALAQEIAPDATTTWIAALWHARAVADLARMRQAADALARTLTSAGDPVVRTWLADALCRQGATERGFALLDAVLENANAKDVHAEAHLVRGLALLDLDKAAARTALTQAEALAPGTLAAAEASRVLASLKAAPR